MQSTSLIVMCVFMTLGMALAMYGGGSYGYSYVPYVPPQQGSGLGEGGLCKYLLDTCRRGCCRLAENKLRPLRTQMHKTF